MLDMNDCQLHLMEASFGAREIVCCVVVAVICWVSSPRWHYKCINCTAARIRHPTCHKMKGYRSLKVFQDCLTLIIWRVRQRVNLGTYRHIETLALKIYMTTTQQLKMVMMSCQSCILGIVEKTYSWCTSRQVLRCPCFDNFWQLADLFDKVVGGKTGWCL